MSESGQTARAESSTAGAEDELDRRAVADQAVSKARLEGEGKITVRPGAR